jgi:hypothetical protein
LSKSRARKTRARASATPKSAAGTADARKTGTRAPRSRKKIALWTVLGLIVFFVLIQFIPYGRNHTDPPATNPFQWSTPTAEAIAQKACYDCHSNDTKWWWAVKIAPFSWLTQRDVAKARQIVNFSDWSGAMSTAAMDRAVNGNMPPLQYSLVHPGAKLSAAEKQTLLRGFQTSLADNSGAGTPAPAASAPASASGAEAIINSRCGACHSAAPALQFRASNAAQAKGMIDAMIQQGASVSASEEQKLIDYYTH